ncbi:hypothetical protein VCSRO12_2226 [Vibrio cholerae]|uniref:hypothetical protein n=1 Tax=Vibrio cholerae TaxID=666 RepID=UPI0011D9F88B|nr:hypothetical protein [Vibrio cholerae]TXZ90952.1 hypothetical protein FXE42_06575 [Vibrio cholerae]GHY65762.1 hypothetical protein VCSRO12_2226 [Vibrio cholerae]
MKRLFIIATLIMSSFSFAEDGVLETDASNTIRLDSLYEKLLPSMNHRDIRVYNDSNSMAYVSVSVVEVLNPGDEKEEVKEPDFGDGPVLSSKAIVIPAEASRSVRIFYPDNILRDNDRFYRVRFTPVSPNKELGFTDEQIKNAQQVSSSFKVSFAWGVLFSVTKKDPQLGLKAELDKNRNLVLKNTGDSLVTISSIVGCSSNNKCKTLANSTRIVQKKTKTLSIDSFIKNNPDITVLNLYPESLSPLSIDIVK